MDYRQFTTEVKSVAANVIPGCHTAPHPQQVGVLRIWTLEFEKGVGDWSPTIGVSMSEWCGCKDRDAQRDLLRRKWRDARLAMAAQVLDDTGWCIVADRGAQKEACP